MRRSKDLVNWEFQGWAFPQIPEEAVEWVHANAGGHGASNIRAAYVIPYKDKYRLYYCVSAHLLRVQEPLYERRLEARQILWGEGELKQEECNVSFRLTLLADGNIDGMHGNWSFLNDKQLLMLNLHGETIENLIIFAGHDWENETEIVLFTGLDKRGRSVWRKRLMK